MSESTTARLGDEKFVSLTTFKRNGDEYGAVLTTKDPDNIPFEMSVEADHP
jgi:hypothetical protein